MAGGVFMGDERDRGAVLIRNKKINKNANIEIDSFRRAHLAAYAVKISLSNFIFEKFTFFIRYLLHRATEQ
jgi:hypothetical protein